MAQEMKNSQICYYVKCMAGIAFLFGFGYLPAIEPITPMGMRILGIFIGAIYLWSVAGVVWPAAFFVNVVATIYLSWAIFYGIAEIAGYKRERRSIPC